jgi:hypothetical protein
MNNPNGLLADIEPPGCVGGSAGISTRRNNGYSASAGCAILASRQWGINHPDDAGSPIDR